MTNEHSAPASSPDRAPSMRVEPKSSEPALLPKQEGAVAWYDFAEDDPDVVLVAHAIAEDGVGRPWDDFLPVNAYDMDHGDLTEYARAAVAALRAKYVTPPSLPLGEGVQKEAQTTKPSPSSTSATATETSNVVSIDLMQRIWMNLYYSEEEAGGTFQLTINDVVDWLAARNALPPPAETDAVAPENVGETTNESDGGVEGHATAVGGGRSARLSQPVKNSPEAGIKPGPSDTSAPPLPGEIKEALERSRAYFLHRATETAGWRTDIENAPGGVRFLIAGRYPNGIWYVEESYRHYAGHFNGRKIDPPTHWMPLPAPPDSGLSKTASVHSDGSLCGEPLLNTHSTTETAGGEG